MGHSPKETHKEIRN